MGYFRYESGGHLSVRKEYREEWENREYAPDQEITEEFEDFLFDEAGRWRFEAEIHDVRGADNAWGSSHRFDRDNWSYSVQQGEPDFDAEVERISLDSDVEVGERTDIRVRFENQSRRDGPHDGHAEFDLLLEWYSPSGRKYSEHWDDIEFGYREGITKFVEDFLFQEAGLWEFEAGIYDNRGYDEGFPSSHKFDDGTWSYTVDAAVPPDDARVADIRVSDSGSAIEVDIENLSSAENLLGGSTHLDLHVTVTTPSGQPVVFTEDDFALLHNQTRTYQVGYTFGESGSFTVLVRIYTSAGMQQNWDAAYSLDTKSETVQLNVADDRVDVCPVVTLEGGRGPWLLKLKVDGVEMHPDSNGCVKLTGDSGSGAFGEGEYLVEVHHSGYLPATLLVYLVAGDSAVYPEVKLLAGDINGDGLVGPEDLDPNEDGVITDADATLLWGSGLADIDGDGDVTLGTDLVAIAKKPGENGKPNLHRMPGALLGRHSRKPRR